jgi:hypothetical protein
MYCGGGHLGFPIGITGLSLTLSPMAKMFQNASSLKSLGQLKPNCPGMIIGRSSTKFMFFMPIGDPFPIDIKNIHLVEDLPMIIPGSLVSTVQVVSEKKHFETFFP